MASGRRESDAPQRDSIHGHRDLTTEVFPHGLIPFQHLENEPAEEVIVGMREVDGVPPIIPIFRLRERQEVFLY